MNKSTLRTNEVYLTVLIERGTNATVRCDFGENSNSIVTEEAEHSPYNLPVAERFLFYFIVFFTFLCFYSTHFIDLMRTFYWVRPIIPIIQYL